MNQEKDILNEQNRKHQQLRKRWIQVNYRLDLYQKLVIEYENEQQYLIKRLCKNEQKEEV